MVQHKNLVSIKEPFPMTLGEIQGHSLTTSPLKCNFWYICAAANKI